MFTEATIQENGGMINSYNIALLVAKTRKSHAITLLRPVGEEVLSVVMHNKSDTITKKILLNKNTIS